MVKLSQNTTNISKVAKAVKAAGGSGVTAINTVRGILGVDLEKAEPSLSTYGGISGEYIRPLGLASVATIAQTTDIPICGVGGISSAENALEYMMLGASTVQVGTEVMIKGKESIRKIVQNLEIWAQNHNVKNLSEIRGKALDNLKAFDAPRVMLPFRFGRKQSATGKQHRLLVGFSHIFPPRSPCLYIRCIV
jgi:dihydroorotate dehydrogenase